MKSRHYHLNLIVFLFMIFSASSFGYTKVLSCQDDSVVIDRAGCDSNGCSYQIVIKHWQALDYLVEKWAISSDEINYKHEFVMKAGYSGYDGKSVFYGETNWSGNGRNEIVITYQKDQAWLNAYFIKGHGHPYEKTQIAHWYFPYCNLSM